jgi:hypothetical protein
MMPMLNNVKRAMMGIHEAGGQWRRINSGTVKLEKAECAKCQRMHDHIR